MTPPEGSGLGPAERYERLERIATGGMGEVWRARDTILGREVAVKVLKHEYADDATFRARFEAEARHAAGLHHPGIASVFDFGTLEEGQTPYLVMELVDGKPLSELLAAGQPFDPEQARLITLQVAEALAVAHAAGVVHRDVKPGNLLVLPDGRVKITDFGIARASGSAAMTQTGQIIGTPHYISPEQAQGHSATAASDVYALGVVLFECLSGHRPYDADTPITTALAHIQRDIPPLPDHVPAELAAVVTRAMAKDAAERYRDGGELATALRDAGTAGGPPTMVAAAPPPGAEQTQVLTGAGGPVAGAATAAPPTPAPAATGALDRPSEEARGAGARRWLVVAAVVALLLLVGALAVVRPWEDSSADVSAADAGETVRVRRAAYLGDPVAAVRAALREKGLKTRTEERSNPGDQEPDTVADLDPTGSVEKGATITLQVWGNPPAVAPTEDTDTSNQGEGNKGKQDGGADKQDKPTKPSKPETSTPTEEPGGQTDAPSDVPAPDSGKQPSVEPGTAGGQADSSGTGAGQDADTKKGS